VKEPKKLRDGGKAREKPKQHQPELVSEHSILIEAGWVFRQNGIEKEIRKSLWFKALPIDCRVHISKKPHKDDKKQRKANVDCSVWTQPK